MAVKKSNTKFWKVLSVCRCMLKFRKLKCSVAVKLRHVYSITDRMKDSMCRKATQRPSPAKSEQTHPYLDKTLCHEKIVITQ